MKGRMETRWVGCETWVGPGVGGPVDYADELVFSDLETARLWHAGRCAEYRRTLPAGWVSVKVHQLRMESRWVGDDVGRWTLDRERPWDAGTSTDEFFNPDLVEDAA